MDRCPRVVMSLPESDAESYSSSHDPSPTLQIDSAAVRLVVETTAQSSSTTSASKHHCNVQITQNQYQNMYGILSLCNLSCTACQTFYIRFFYI